ncbi:MAG: anthranilate phosphoribosyltransferase [Actinomycetota bacterium]
MLSEVLVRVTEGETLDRETAHRVMSLIMRGEATDAQIASLLTALRMRGETPEEIAGFAQAMRDAAMNIRPTVSPLVDTCGTGGDGRGTFNISTAAAFIAAGAGVYVAKHGNRGVSSACGSADVLEALGVNIEADPEKIRACIEEVGIGFLFAPRFHPAMRHVMRARKEMGIPTAFNLLGPLTNPAGAQFQLLGVGRREKAPLIAGALAGMGVRKALVVHGEDGLDEISTASPTLVWEVEDGKIRESRIDPGELGLPPADPGALRGGSAKENARIIREDVLSGKPGPRRDVAVLNAAAVLYAAGKAADLREGMALAEEAVDSGRAMRKLEMMVEFSREESRVS